MTASTDAQRFELPEQGAQLPDERGYFGPYGGRFVAETLIQPLAELEAACRALVAGCRFSGRAGCRPAGFRRSSDTVVLCRTLDSRDRRRPYLAET